MRIIVSGRGIALLLSFALIGQLTACADDDAKGEADPFEIHIAADGKADGDSGVLSGEDLDRVKTAFDDVLASGDQTIASLEAEIARLEASNQAKANQIDALVRQITARRAELEQIQNQNLVLCVFFPTPATCVLAVIIANDSRMQSLERDRQQAVAAQTQIQNDLARYRQRRAALRAQITPLRESRQRLIAALAGGDSTIPLPAELEPGSITATAYVRATIADSIAVATRAEIGLLVEIRNAAADLAASLDAALATIRALATSVDALVDDARDQFMDLLEALLSDDPDAIARDWLDDALATRTRELLRTLGWPVGQLVEHLLATRPGDELDLEALARDLLAALKAPDDVVLTSTVELQILDNTLAISRLEMPTSMVPSRVEVSVRIEHSYIGDLWVAIDHGGTRVALHDRTGGATHDLNETFSLDLPAGLDARGDWRLRVADESSPDQGRLLGWTLILHP